MGTTADKLNKLLQTKSAIKEAIQLAAGSVAVQDNTPFAEYPEIISKLSTVFKFNYDPSTQSIDCSFTDIRNALDSGRTVICMWDNLHVLGQCFDTGESTVGFRGMGDWSTDETVVTEYTVLITAMFDPLYVAGSMRGLKVMD